MVLLKKNISISDVIPGKENRDVLLNKVIKEVIREDLLSVYSLIHDGEDIKTLIVPDVLVDDTLRNIKFYDIPSIDAKFINAHGGIFVDEDIFDEYKYELSSYSYIGNKEEDIVLDIYSSEVKYDPKDNGVLRLLKRLLNDTSHFVENETHRSRLTQLYSKVRGMSSEKEDKSSLYSKLKILEQYSEGVYLTVVYRDKYGELKEIQEKINI